MTKPVKLSDILRAMELTSDKSCNYLDLTDGEVVFVTYEILHAAEDGPRNGLPEWQKAEWEAACRIAADEEGRFLKLPSEFQIDERRIMEQFCEFVGDSDVAYELRHAMKDPHPLRRFIDTAHALHVSDKWYHFRKRHYADAARDWCRRNEVDFTDDVERA